LNDIVSIHEVKDKVASILQGQGLNVLLNNGATHTTTGLADVTADEMIENYKTNVVGPVLCVQVQDIAKFKQFKLLRFVSSCMKTVFFWYELCAVIVQASQNISEVSYY